MLDIYRVSFRLRNILLLGIGTTSYAKSRILHLHSPEVRKEFSLLVLCARSSAESPNVMAAMIKLNQPGKLPGNLYIASLHLTA